MKGRATCWFRVFLIAAMAMLCGGRAVSLPAPPVAVPARQAGAAAVTNLRCEYLRDPLGIDAARPRLSWVIQSDRRGERQTAYRVLVASTPELLAKDEGDLWDSGTVASDQSVHVEYTGKPLASRQQCFWKVRAWDQNGAPSNWSAPARWEMGVLAPEDWRAQWVRRSEPEPKSDEDRFNDQPAPLLRKEFTVEKPVARARAYVSGLGYYELRLNGRRVGDHALDPGWTTYSKRVLYSTYDVTPYMKEGRNAVGIMLGNGWYNPLPLRMWSWLNLRQHLTIGRPPSILQLAIDYADGTSQTVVTDTTWKTSQGPILRNSVYLGEVYDARCEQPGWDQPDFNESNWETAVAATEPLGLPAAPGTPSAAQAGPLRAQSAPPIRVTRVLRPVQRTQPKPGTYLFDFGQNFAGWVTLRVKGPAGTTVRLRYGELLYPGGTLNAMTSVPGQVKGGGTNYVYPGTGAPKTAWQSDVYILKGGAEETYTPRFTFHGFRYVEVTGYPGEPPLTALEGLRLNSAVERAGTFACSNERFNQIQRMIEWTFLANLFSVQSDCPHREKFGYGGDIAATSETFLLNFDMARFYEKTVHDYADAVRPNGGMTETAPFVGIADGSLGGGSGPVGWGTAFPHLQWQLYQYYGDRRILEEHYPLTRSWVEFLRGRAKDHILDNGLSDHESLVPKAQALTGTAFYYYNVHVLSRIARVLGKTQDAEQYTALAGEIKQAFNRRFLKPGTGAYDTATQVCQTFALFLDLVPPEEKQNALQVLVRDILESHRGHLTTGIFGTRFLPLVLSDGGRLDVAYTVANQKDFPGWGHMLERGATTIWEHWEFSDNIFSHNHPAFGSIGEWFLKSLAGLQPDPEMVGCDRIIIRPACAACLWGRQALISGSAAGRPQPTADLTWARGEYQSIRGRVASEWRVEEGKITLNVTIPPNATATVFVPTRDPEAVLESGQPASQAPGLRFLRREQGAAVFQAGSGRYRFTAPIAK
ncbi:MAG: family 78 glycoside hydrolase catalytic domain [Chloroflexi bacterium]|nr:family 78 glycoside hydrolase catalytic domain [Chloroflexota bacterium]